MYNEDKNIQSSKLQLYNKIVHNSTNILQILHIIQYITMLLFESNKIRRN